MHLPPFLGCGEVHFIKTPWMTSLSSSLKQGKQSSVGLELGDSLGKRLGSVLGERLGSVLGERLGSVLGERLGSVLGARLGSVLGARLGSVLGDSLGERLGSVDGGAVQDVATVITNTVVAPALSVALNVSST